MIFAPQAVVQLSFPTQTRRTRNLLRSISPLTALCIILTGAAVHSVKAQRKTARQDKPAAQEKPAATVKTPPQDKGQAQVQGKTPTAEQVAEAVIFSFGSRGVLEQIRRNGIE